MAVPVILGLIAIGCGAGSPAASTTGTLSGNWQINMTQNYPQVSTLSASGFLVEAKGALSGSVQGPYINGSSNNAQNCGGAGPLNGTVNGQNVTFSLNPGGTVFNFTGVVSGNKAMSGTYSGLGGACFPQSATSGTFTAQLIPPLNGSFTGAIASGNYMEALTGSTSPVPVSVSGSFTQDPSAEGSSATLTGTITAVSYPCFTTASLTGTISGQTVYLTLYGYNGNPIGTMGQLSAEVAEGGPATVVVKANSISITDSALQGFDLTNPGPCPAVYNSSGIAQTSDYGSFTLALRLTLP